MTALPQRLTVETCIGCGAIGGLGDCETGCSEQRLELVPAIAFDELVQLAAEQAHCLAAFLAIAEQLSHLADVEELEPAYRVLQAEARAALRRHPELDWARAEIEHPAAPITSWWCERCGAVDAPQPCLGVCIRRLALITPRDGHWQDAAVALAHEAVEVRERVGLRAATNAAIIDSPA